MIKLPRLGGGGSGDRARLADEDLMALVREGDSAAFEVVYEEPDGAGPETSGAGLWTQGDLVYASGNATVAVSDDDGLTWTSIDSWR